MDAMIVADFGGWLSNVAASVVAGVIVLWIAFRWVEAELSLHERSERQRENEEQRRQTREAVLKNVHAA